MYMGIVRWCGHDSRGIKIPHDDVPRIAHSYARLSGGDAHIDRFGFRKHLSEIANHILVPKYYDPDIDATLNALQETHDLITIGQLVNQGILAITTGDEVGK